MLLHPKRNAAKSPSAPSHVLGLTDHLDQRGRADLSQMESVYGRPYAAAGGWLLVTLEDWDRQHVLFSNDGDHGGDDAGVRLLYQCSCAKFQVAAPLPCAHVVMAGLLGVDARLIDGQGRLTPAVAQLPPSRTKPLSPRRPVAAIAADGAVQLVRRNGQPVRGAKPKAPPWQPFFQQLRNAPRSSSSSGAEARERWPAGREVVYVLDASATLTGQGLVLDTMFRERKKDGQWRKPQPLSVSPQTLGALPDESDRELIGRLVGTTPVQHYSYYGSTSEPASRRRLAAAQEAALLPMLCQTGRCFLRHPGQKDVHPQPLRWDDHGTWELVLDIERDETSRRYVIGAHLQRDGGRDGERADLRDPVLLTSDGHVFFADRVAPLRDFGAFAWAALLRERGAFHVPLAAGAELLAELYRVPQLPRLNVPAELTVEDVIVPMQPRLKIAAPKQNQSWSYGPPKLRATLTYDYGGHHVDAHTPAALGILQPQEHRLVRRDVAAEAAAQARLQSLGFRFNYDPYDRAETLQVPQSRLPDVIRQLTREQWHVEAEGKLYRQPGEFKIDVSSGIDWFDLTARVDFGGQSATLPALLAALRKGEHVVKLDDGTFGMLPEEWLKKYGGLAEIGTVEDDGRVRFKRAQVGLLDALLASRPEATFDETFRRTRDELRAFDGVAPLDPPATFTGELRPYQRDALGWFDFLRRFGFGGCLADDMGLGKTVQVLALLESRRTEQPGAHRPALVVVPRSLVFNWKQEAARFAPGLRVLDHTQPGRPKSLENVGAYDLILTTYGTLRRDVAHLSELAFDYAILDEAQAVKNPSSESAKAVRLLQGTHRLVLTGTPVQNHLGDHWSLFDFLNPGRLGAVSAFNGAGSSSIRTPDEETRAALSRGLRPFILRRTKEQVARDLPAKLEQTLYCDLEPPQRKLYDELRDHYRQTLLGKIAADGMAKSKIQILDALLRLRQAACHPGLIDKSRVKDCSAKLDVLMPRLAEANAEGHKVLVFSQFTSFLALLRTRLDAEKTVYQYLDGKTRDRQARVERFQSDPECKLFLISLKAGGVGLNLTAADYVFLLDPWWNPAIEAQAIDRTHRIGQTRQVFACRLIAKDTVEEKVLALQQSKKDLADAIINADNSLIRTLRREDLELLLS
jgi:superfamily II DNA or RNA helicase